MTTTVFECSKRALIIGMVSAVTLATIIWEMICLSSFLPILLNCKLLHPGPLNRSFKILINTRYMQGVNEATSASLKMLTSCHFC